MIEFVSGRLDWIDTEYIVIEVNGVGYQLICPNPYAYQARLNEQVTVYTYQYVREDALRLYGFQSRTEKKLFEKLLNVSGIGPKGGLAIVAAGNLTQLAQAIEEENEKFLVKYPGVGKKTARQMILDLKGKLAEFLPNLLNEHEFDEGAEQLMAETIETDHLSEAVEALKALGYVEREIKKVLPTLRKEELSTDQYIKKALQLMFKQ
ncbi:MAG TPA: Holliday junction branch migration protein RuvA [Bacilli bacterium]|nr:Holliday junction branch migration protein RuvA [Bacilli bacterium]